MAFPTLLLPLWGLHATIQHIGGWQSDNTVCSRRGG